MKLTRSVTVSRIYPTNTIQTFFMVIFGLAVISFSIAVAVNSWGCSDNKIFEVCFVLVGTFIGGGFIIGSIQNRLGMREFEKGSTKTTATVIDRYVVEGPECYNNVSYKYYVVVKFIAVQKVWTLKAIVCQELYDKTDQVKKLSVIYADSDPRIVLLEGEVNYNKVLLNARKNTNKNYFHRP